MNLGVLCDVQYPRHLAGVWDIPLHVPVCHCLHHQAVDLGRHILRRERERERERGREGGREREREGGREGGREREREGGREGGREEMENCIHDH